MKKWIFAFLAVVVGVAYQNCSSYVSSSSGNGSPSTTAFSLRCEPNDPRNPADSELKKLNKYELQNTIIDLFEPHMTANQRNEFRNVIAQPIADIPDDRVETGMDLANQGVSVTHVERHFLLAEIVADFVSQRSSIMNSILGGCAGSPDTDACRRDFLNTFGARILRRPLTADDITHYLQTMTGHSDSYRNVIAQMIASPFFYYHNEYGQSAPDESLEEWVVQLDSYEKANKISYFLLQSMPDDELFAAAANGTLDSQSGLAQQVDRLLNSPKARERLTRYFANQWLHLDETANLRLDIQEVQTRLSELSNPAPVDTLRDDLIQEVYDYFDYLMWEQQASYSELMTSNLVFPRSPAMATIYGTQEWNGQYDLASLIRAPENERSGVLTRAQFLYTGSGSTRPIMRGVHVYRDFMCQNLNLPPDNSTPEGVVITDDMTDQEIVRATTEVPGTACVQCHERVINPLGFAFDNFDPMGRYITQERVFHPEGDTQAGEVLVSKDVDPSGNISTRPFVDGQVNDAIDLTRRLASSPDAHACFSSKLWNFAQKKNMRVSENACAVQSIYQTLAAGDASIVEAIRTLVLQPEFMKRKIQ